MSISEPEVVTGSFAEQFAGAAEASSAAPEGLASAGTSQKMELFANGASIGWLGENSGEWCVVAAQDAAVSIEPYVWKNVLYYRNANSTSRYLSVSDNSHYVGFYNWMNARGWTLNGNVLTSLYTNAQLSFWSSENGYVYANSGSGYTPLTVAFH
jgi:hypothetical protein